MILPWFLLQEVGFCMLPVSFIVQRIPFEHYSFTYCFGVSYALFSYGSSPMVWGILIPNAVGKSCTQLTCCSSPYYLGSFYSNVIGMPCVQFTRHSSPITWGIPWSNTVGKSCARCLPSITWRVLGPISLECLMCGSYTVYPLLLGEFLGPMLLDCLVCNSCIVHPLLFFGEFLLLLYFRKTLFLVCAILLPLFTWAFCSFSFRVSSVC